MNKNKDENMSQAREEFSKAGIYYSSFNDGLHWKIGSINFYPTTHKWHNEMTEERGIGIKDALKEIRKPKNANVRILTTEQLFEIAKHSKDKSLFGICESIHKEIYK